MKLWHKQETEDLLNYQPDAVKPKGNFSSKRIALAVVIVLAAMLMFVVATSNNQKPTGDEEAKAAVAAKQRQAEEARAKAAAALPSATDKDGRAVGQLTQNDSIPQSKPTPPPASANSTVPDKGDEPKFIGPTSVDPEAQEKLRQKSELARKKFAKEQEAFGSGLLVKHGEGGGPQAAQAATAQPANGPNPTAYEPASSGPSNDYNVEAAKDKEQFFTRADQDQWLSPYTREAGRPFELKTGAVIPGVMVTGINSDLPGAIIGQVAQDVYDTATGHFLLLPKGSKIYGVYDARVAYGQRRALIAWNRVLFPDGSSVTLGAMPGGDISGYAGFEDQVDNHYMRIFGSAVLMSFITGGTAYAVDKATNDGSGDKDQTTLQDEMTSALAAQLGQTATALIQKNLNISPTVTIRPGYAFNIVVTKDIVFQEPYHASR